MNVLEKISKNLSECTQLGISAANAFSLSIFSDNVLSGKHSCTLLLKTGTEIPEIIKNDFNREVINGLHYYTHPDYITTFTFSNSSK